MERWARPLPPHTKGAQAEVQSHESRLANINYPQNHSNNQGSENSIKYNSINIIYPSQQFV